MTCHNCQNAAKKHGKAKNGLHRFRCTPCNRTFCEDHVRPLGDMRIALQKAILAVQLIVEGNSIRSTERVTGLHRDTILDLLVLLGERCQRIMDDKIQNIPVREVQADEIWGYVFKRKSTSGFVRLTIISLAMRIHSLPSKLIQSWFSVLSLDAVNSTQLCIS